MYICNSNFDSVAQLVEQKTLNLWVLGSSPSGVTFKAEKQLGNVSRERFYI
jgi:hypothetical protein